jgi:hypothetical protein
MTPLSLIVIVSRDDPPAGECAGHRALMQERVRGLLRFQSLDAGLATPIRALVNRRLHRPDRFAERDQGRLDGLCEARRALWEGQ